MVMKAQFTAKMPKIQQIMKLFLALFLISFLFTPLLAPAQAVQEQFQVYPEYEQLNVCSCATAKNRIFIENTGDTASRFVTTESGAGAPYTDYTDGRFSLKPGERHEITQFVTVPCKKEGSFTVNTTISSVFDQSATLSTQVHAKACENLQVQLKKAQSVTPPCTPAPFEFTVRNPSGFFEVYQFEVLQITGPRILTEEELRNVAILSKQELVVAPGKTETLSLIMHLPCGEYGQYDFSLGVKTKNSGFAVEIPFTLTIAQHYAYGFSAPLSLKDMPVCKNFGTEVPTVLTNLADFTNTYDLSAQLTDGKTQHYDPVSVGSRSALPVNLVVEGNAPAGEQTLVVTAESRLGGLAQTIQIPVSVVYCDENGAPLPPEDWPQDTTWLWVLGGVALIILLIIVGAGVILARRKAEEPAPAEGIEGAKEVDVKRKSKHLEPLLASQQEGLEDPRKPYLMGLLIVVILLLAVLLGAVYYYQVYLPQQELELPEEGAESVEVEQEQPEQPVEETEQLPEEEIIEEPGMAMIRALAILVILLIILVVLGVIYYKKKKAQAPRTIETKKEVKDDKKAAEIQLPPGDEAKNTWKWIFVVLLILLLLTEGMIAGLYFTQKPRVDEATRTVYIDTTNLEGSDNLVYIKQQPDPVMVPLILRNKGQQPISVGLDFDLPWLTVSNSLVELAPGAVQQEAFTVRSQDAETGKYRFIVDIKEDEGNIRQETIIIEIYTTWPSYKYYISALIVVGALWILVLLIFIIALIVSWRKRKGLAGATETEARAFITAGRKALATAEDKKKKEEKKEEKPELKIKKEFPKFWKKALIYVLLFVILGLFVAGIYGLSTKYEISVPAVNLEQPAKVPEAKADRMKIDIDGKTLLPVIIENVNEDTLYEVTLQNQSVNILPGEKGEVKVFITPKEKVERVPLKRQEAPEPWKPSGKVKAVMVLALIGLLAAIPLVLLYFQKQRPGPQKEALKEMALESKQHVTHGTEKTKAEQKKSGRLTLR